MEDYRLDHGPRTFNFNIIYSPLKLLAIVSKNFVFFTSYLNFKCMQPHYCKIYLSTSTVLKTTHQNLIILFGFVLHIVHIIISYQLQREQNIEFNIPSMFNLVQKLIQTILDLSIYSYSLSVAPLRI